MVDERNIVEVIYGKHYKYEIVKSEGNLISSPTYSIFRNGKFYRGTYSSVADAVQAAKREG